MTRDQFGSKPSRRGLVGLGALALALACLAPGVANAQTTCYVSYVWTVSEDDNLLRRVELPGMTVDQTVVIDVGPQTPVTGITGLAIHPTTGEYFMLAYLQVPSNPGIPFLIKYDEVSGLSTVLGSTFVNFIALEFQPDGTLNAISADTANPTNSFCILNQLTGAPIDICLYGNGDDGEAIGWHPGEGRMYHASGLNNVIFEASTAGAPSPCTSDAITPSASLTGAEVTGLTFSLGLDAFVWSQDGLATSDLYSVTNTGAATLIGTADHTISDVAIFELPTPCPPMGNEFVRGDANGDSGINIADAVFLLNQLFVPGSLSSTCPDATDFNDDGGVNIADAIYLLNGLFSPTGTDPPAPFPDCGEDPTSDSLECPMFNCP